MAVVPTGHRGAPLLGRETTASLTHFADGEGAGVAGVDLGCPAPGEVEQLHQAGDHLVLLFGMAQPAIATEAPGEDAFLGVEDQLRERRHRVGDRPASRRGGRGPHFCSREPGPSAKGKGPETLKRLCPATCLRRWGGGNRSGSSSSNTRTVPGIPCLLLFKSQVFPVPHQKRDTSISPRHRLSCRKDQAGLPPRFSLDSPLPHPVPGATSTWTFQQFKMFLSSHCLWCLTFESREIQPIRTI